MSQPEMQVHISLQGIGKKFGSEWIFRKVSHEIKPEDKLVILGGNGSGKSTLLQIISGFVSANEGKIIFSDTPGKSIDPDRIHTLVSFASPYLQLIEDFTLEENIDHAKTFKPFKKEFSSAQIIEKIELGHAKKKMLKQFSSGMKQRLKLGLAILADTPVLLLDEPSSNLDKDGIEWYKKMIEEHSKNRTVIVCSNNIDHEFYFCTTHLNVMDFKQLTERRDR
jgi:ABC-type multidrug transport system ATPase subunit